MKRPRIVGLVLLAAIVAGVAAIGLMRRAPDTAPAPPAPPRESFHPAKPLRLEVQLPTSASNDRSTTWLARELRHLLIRGKMKVFADQPASTGVQSAFTLRVTVGEDGKTLLELIAPDSHVERSTTFALDSATRLSSIRAFAGRLPSFLQAPGGLSDWSSSIGTEDAGAYEAFLDRSDALRAADASGFTAPPEPQAASVQTIEHLESLSRRQRGFARARALLALGYLSLGGEDQASLTKLAQASAERALTLDADLADAHAALGIVRLRRMEWSAAREHFDAALAIDADSLPALEGLACLLMDVGDVEAALPIAIRATAQQPGNRGARQCAAYAQIARGALPSENEALPADSASIYGAILLLGGNAAGAEQLLRANHASSDEIVTALIQAGGSRSKAADALQAVTRAADEGTIDAQTELLYGAALRRPDFVFNRMLRLAQQKQAVPARLLWLPQTDYLRKHRRFKEVVSATALTTYWQDHGLPDVCETEPKMPGCTAKPR